MSSTKYKLKKDKSSGLFRLVATRDFGNVAKGDLGGLVDGPDNLSQEGNCWVFGTARVYGNALVSGTAEVFGTARVYGTAQVSGDAQVSGNAWVYGDAVASRSPVTVGLQPHPITVTDNHIQIGCELHTKEEWLANYKTIGVENSYTKEQIKWYGALIKLLLALPK